MHEIQTEKDREISHARAMVQGESPEIIGKFTVAPLNMRHMQHLALLGNAYYDRIHGGNASPTDFDLMGVLWVCSQPEEEVAKFTGSYGLEAEAIFARISEFSTTVTIAEGALFRIYLSRQLNAFAAALTRCVPQPGEKKTTPPPSLSRLKSWWRRLCKNISTSPNAQRLP